MMTIQEIIEIFNNKLSGVGQRRNDAFKQGDLDVVAALDAQLEELSATIEKIKSLL